MKKLILLSCTIFFCQWTNAQWFGKNTIKGNGHVITKQRSTSDYDQIKMAGFFDVELVHGTEGAIVITGEENLIPHIITEVSANMLTIKTEDGYNLKPSKRTGILVKVPFESLNEVSLTGSGDIQGEAVIRSSNFKAKLTGSGDMDLRLEAETVESLVVGSGDLELEGTTNKVVHKVTGSGDIDASELRAMDAEAIISGSGDIDLYSDGFLKIRIAGSGDVNYDGNPTKEDTKIAGSGEVSRD